MPDRTQNKMHCAWLKVEFPTIPVCCLRRTKAYAAFLEASGIRLEHSSLSFVHHSVGDPLDFSMKGEVQNEENSWI